MEAKAKLIAKLNTKQAKIVERMLETVTIFFS